MKVAPGASGSLEFAPGVKGLLQVWVDTEFDEDAGTLRVEVSGAAPDEGRIAGHTLWSYAVLSDGGR